MEEPTVRIMNEKIPRELILEIFSRIPVKWLFQLRCVCKQWCNFIDDPCLPNMHLAQATTREEALILAHWFHVRHRTSSLRLMKEHDRSPKATVEFPNRGRYDLENSCHGLLCFVKCGKEEEALVSNPLRGELLMLPESTVMSRWPHLDRYGLGFDSSIKKYKIVHVFFRDFDWAKRGYRLGAEVYTVGTTSSWREISQIPCYPLYKRAVYASGALHWLVNYEFNPDNLKSMVISFNIKDEEFNSIPHQEFPSKVSKWFELVDLRGYLGMVDFSLGTHIEIWKLKDYEKKEWVREYRIDIKPPHGVSISQYIEVVGLMGDGEILLERYKKLVAYNPKTNGLRRIQTLNNDPDMDTPQVYVYTASLVSISGAIKS